MSEEAPPAGDGGMLLGDFLRSNGFVTAEAILQCVDHQQKAVALGETPPPLGRLLVELGHIDALTLEEALSLHVTRTPGSATATGNMRTVQMKVAGELLDGTLLLEEGTDLGSLFAPGQSPRFFCLHQGAARRYVNAAAVQWVREVGD